jgi:hypothetical protein
VARSSSSALAAVVSHCYTEDWLESQGLPDAYVELWPDGTHVVLKARSKGKWLACPIDLSTLPEEPGEIVETVEALVAGLIAEATELPDHPIWLAQQEERC